MVYTFFVLIIFLVLLSPLPFTSPWYGGAYAQTNKTMPGPPTGALVQNSTGIKLPDTFMAYNENFAKIANITNRANTTATNLAHDMLMDVRYEYVDLNRTSHQLNRTLANLSAIVLDNARTTPGFGIFGAFAVQTSSNVHQTFEMLKNDTAEYVRVQDELKSKTNQFKISPNVYALFENSDKKIWVHINLISNNSLVPLNEDEIVTQLDKIILAVISESRIRDLAEHDQVRSIRLPHTIVHTAGSQISEGVSLSQANILHDKGITGKNITIAIVDVSFDPNDAAISPRVSYSALFRSCSDLLCGASNPHGTLVSHIVADMAPDANLELYAVNTAVSVVEAISHIIARGKADVLTISLSIPGLGGDGSTKHYRDGTSSVAQAVDRARENGILVTVSSGNWADKHWSGTYVPSSTVTPELIPQLDSYQSILEVNPSASGLQKACLSTNSKGQSIILAWDAWNQNPVRDDYDLFLFSSDMSELYAYSTNWQPIGYHPVEDIEKSPISGNKCIVVASKFSTQNHNLHIYALGATLTPNTVEGSISTPADARGAVSVGAVHYSNKIIEKFSSTGPTDDGREKPEICGYDDVRVLNYKFRGTSASAPHVAGMAALLLDANPSATADEIQHSIETSAEPGPEGCGYGIMSLHDAAELLPTVTISGGVNQSYVKAGDLATVYVSANNTISSVSATIFGRSVQANHSGNTTNATVTVLENDPQGFVDFSLNIVDVDGNLVTATPQILTGSNIQVDTIAPNMESSYASSLNSVTVVFSEDIRAESVSIDDFTMNNVVITGHNVSSDTVNLLTSTLNISSLPSLNLSRSVEDLAGNSISGVSIPTVVGFDATDIIAPKFVSLEAYSSNPNTTLAKANDIITVNLTTYDTASSANATMLGRVIQPVISGNHVTFELNVASDDVQGLVNFTLFAYDEQNNTLQITQENLTTRNVIVDTISPEMLSVKTASNGIIALNFSEELDAASVSGSTFTVIAGVKNLIGVASAENTVNMKTTGFSSGAAIKIFINGTLSDLAGNQLTLNGYNNTEDGVRPMMIDAYPFNEQTIIVRFDESIKSPLQPSDFEITGIDVKSVTILSPNNTIQLITDPFERDDLLSVSINGTVEDLSGNLVLQNIPIEFRGSLNSLSAIFTAKRIDTSTIELSFTLNGRDVIDLVTASYNTDTFSITDPFAEILSWNIVPYNIPAGYIINRDLKKFNLTNHDHFGTSLASADFDDDGTIDLAVGALGDGAGFITIVYMNPDGSANTFHRLDYFEINNFNFDTFGTSLAAGDFDGDGTPDLAIGDPGDGNGSGAVHIAYLHSNGTVNSTVKLTGFNLRILDTFGTSLAAEDFDGDGVPDLAIGAPGDGNGSGAVHIAYLYSNGTVNSTVKLTGFNLRILDTFGTSLAAGDFDGDGTPDLVIGAPGDGNGSGAVHIAYLYSNGTVKDTIKIFDPDNTGFGSALSVMRDIDGDGRSEFAAVALEQYRGIVHTLHPKADNVVFSTSLGFNYGFGTSLAYTGIISNNSTALAVGTPFSSDTKGKGIDTGTVLFLYYGDHLQITTSEIQDPNQTPLVTYNENIQSNLTVDGDTVSNGTSAVASAVTSALNTVLESAHTINASTVNATFSRTINASSVDSTDFLINGIQPIGTIVYDNVVTLTTNTLFSSDATPYIAYVGMIQDLSGFSIQSHGVTATDGIPPQIISSTTLTPYLGSVTFDESVAITEYIDFAVDITGSSPTSFNLKDGSVIPKSILEITISQSTPFESNSKPEIKFDITSDYAEIIDLAGNSLSSITITASDGIGPSIKDATVVSSNLIEVYFDEDVQFIPGKTPLQSLVIDGSLTFISSSISGNTLGISQILSPFSHAALNINFTEASSNIEDTSGNSFTSSSILTNNTQSSGPYISTDRIIVIPYNTRINIATLDVSDYTVSYGLITDATIDSIALSNDDTTVTLTMVSPFGTGTTPFIEQSGDILNILGNSVNLARTSTQDLAPPVLVYALSTTPTEIILTFSEPITGPSGNSVNYAIIGAEIRDITKIGSNTVLISASPFISAIVQTAPLSSIQDFSGNIAERGTNQNVFKIN